MRSSSHQPFTVRCKIAGEAGDGIMTAGDLLLKAIARQGFEASVAKSFPSNIRGGYAQSLITISDTTIVSPLGESTILFTLSRDAFLLDTVQLHPGTVVLVETTVINHPDCTERRKQLDNTGIAVFSVPVKQLARETAGSGTLRSTVAAGVTGALLGIQKKLLSGAITERFEKKSTETLELNRIALESGQVWAQQHLTGTDRYRLPSRRNRNGQPDQYLIIDGNQAVALGALYAGCTFYASYPITPATAIGEMLARELPGRNGFAYQAEDEIAALGTVIGASFCGIKAMTATSGPGLSLMQEFIGYASMVELPVVIVDVQRAGPSTGMPTKHSQDDLHAAVFGGHGEGQRIVIAPLNIEDCFSATVTAFNAAEKYQCPVILLSDSTLGMTRTTVSRLRLNDMPVVNRSILKQGDSTAMYRRYHLSCSGTVPIAVPGISTVSYRATGVEHGEDSAPVTTPTGRTAQMERRYKKIAALERWFTDPVIWDDESSDENLIDIGICSWGLTASVCREAVASLRRQGLRVCAFYPRLLFPVCTDAVNRWARRCSLQVVVEANHTGQYGLLLRMYTDARPAAITVSRGEPFTPEEIVERLTALMQSEKHR
ncbi:MAG: 2-oxoacid:acceptor oxidoreductase subunit alpha [Chitinispirillaceae bacterium]|nr:2-oxoacid:acceptor oxidoreductase subunit alpha [Chitinispirillaceae bacterium]